MSDTDTEYGATRSDFQRVAFPAIFLWFQYGVSGTDVGYAATRLLNAIDGVASQRVGNFHYGIGYAGGTCYAVHSTEAITRYAMSDTDPGYGITYAFANRYDLSSYARATECPVRLITLQLRKQMSGTTEIEIAGCPYRPKLLGALICDVGY
eukprot:3941266-Rhodomonas_salina.5